MLSMHKKFMRDRA